VFTSVKHFDFLFLISDRRIFVFSTEKNVIKEEPHNKNENAISENVIEDTALDKHVMKCISSIEKIDKCYTKYYNISYFCDNGHKIFIGTFIH
jgi:hypothetical protein